VIIRHYFAYGSNMNVERVRSRRMPFLSVTGGRLTAYELLFDKAGREHDGRAHANIAPRAGSVVEGVLYELSDPADIQVMDRFENTPINYSRDVIRVDAASAVIPAWTYFANPAVRKPGLHPERAYLEHLLAGAPYLSAAYLHRLRNVVTLEAAQRG
jgi:hypothetical protein